MARKPEIGNVQLYPNRPLRASDKNGFVLKFYCPIQCKRIRKNCGTRDRREARRILRECRERLLDGSYVKSGGAITTEYVENVRTEVYEITRDPGDGKTWRECYEQYDSHLKMRVRGSSLADTRSRLQIAERILEARRDDNGLTSGGTIREFSTLEAMEYLQDRLMAGDEGRFDCRTPMTVNSMIGAVMAFVRYCHMHEWIDRVPPLRKLDVEEVMKGRPITPRELQCMLDATPDVVGKRASESWKHLLQILWESAFRVGDVMNFSWDDERRIHPIWPARKNEYATLAIPSSQKNKKVQEIPLLPGLQSLLEETPIPDRTGWIVNPLSMDYEIAGSTEWFRPSAKDLETLTLKYSNCAIARACCVSETTIRRWLQRIGIERECDSPQHRGDINAEELDRFRRRAECRQDRPAHRAEKRLTKERVSRIIGMIGKEAQVVVQKVDESAGRRVKYASAHDIRRGCAYRLINAGISAETLKVVLRHKDFNTTERFYGASRAAQAAAIEIHEKLIIESESGSNEIPAPLSSRELQKLKLLLRSL